MKPEAPPASVTSWPHRLIALLRNAIPVLGVFAFGWSPTQYVLLFLADACLRPGSLGAAKLLGDFGALAEGSGIGWAERLDGVVTIFGAGLFIAALLFAVFGVPLFALLLSSEGWTAELRTPSFQIGAVAVLLLAGIQAVADARRLARDAAHEAALQRRVAGAMALLAATYFCALVATFFGGAGLRVLAVLLALLVTYADWYPEWPERVLGWRTPVAPLAATEQKSARERPRR